MCKEVPNLGNQIPLPGPAVRQPTGSGPLPGPAVRQPTGSGPVELTQKPQGGPPDDPRYGTTKGIGLVNF